MNSYSVTIQRTTAELAGKAEAAESFFKRCRGLLGRSALLSGEGLIIRPCKMVHMWFMTFPIDVVFCNSVNEVLAIDENLRPWKVSRHEAGAAYVLELPAGICREKELRTGDVLVLKAVQ